MLVKQFVTCEGRYRLIFLYHLWLLMNFIGYPLNMPFYFQCNLYKMSKRFKREKADSSLFHHGLIKLIVVYHLSLHGDSWRDFVARNGSEDTNPIQVDKPVVSEVKARPPVPFHILLTAPKLSVYPPIDLPDIGTEKSETIKKPISKILRNNPSYPGIKLPSETLSNVSKPSHVLSKPTQSSCD
jgi:hypothetical protein